MTTAEASEPADGTAGDMELAQLYRHRFDDDDRSFKAAMWRVLCDDFFQRFVRPTDVVVDLGAGSCEFINAIRAGRKIAVDLNPDTAKFARGAEPLALPVTDLSPLETQSVDVVFTSNVLEHMPDKQSVLQVLRESRRVLKVGGRLIVLMPNVRYLPGRYWDYFDHHTPLSHLSLAEGMALASFDVERSIPRFLPYTVKQARGLRSTALVRLYLRMPFVWPLLGKQMLVIGVRST